MKFNTNMRVTHISDEVREIAPTEKEGMLVPVRIYAMPTILESMDAGVFEQVTSIACLLELCDMHSACRTVIGLRFSHWRHCRL